MLGAEHLFADRQGALVERPRPGKVALGLKQTREVVEARRRMTITDGPGCISLCDSETACYAIPSLSEFRRPVFAVAVTTAARGSFGACDSMTGAGMPRFSTAQKRSPVPGRHFAYQQAKLYILECERGQAQNPRPTIAKAGFQRQH